MLSPSQFREIVSGQRRDLIAAAARGLLQVAELPYECVVNIRNRRFDNGKLLVEKAAVPVISVGNLTLGGTGKTPTVAWLARWFRGRNVKVAIISRGYGAGEDRMSDEARELAARLPDVPHIQNPDRLSAASIATEELGMQLIILDDGFQHRRIARDLDIVLIDATEPFGFDHLFPRGTLREPITGLGRAKVIGLTRCDMIERSQIEAIKSRIKGVSPGATWIELVHRPSHLLTASGNTHACSELSGKTIVGFCGIGNPKAFQHTLTDCGGRVIDLRQFPDHYNYSRDDIHDLSTWANQSSAAAVVCTHKDLVKIGIECLGDVPLYALAIDVEITSGQEALESELQLVLGRVSSDD